MNTRERATDTAATWWSQAGNGDDVLVAYFSMEFGVDARLPIYSGGLGILAGDHLKAAAELGVPIVGVGLLYRGGYFVQGLSDEGRQTETYAAIDPEALGLHREPATIEVGLADETVTADVWRYDVGVGTPTPVPLYLLDVDLLTDALYAGDREHRIRQELLLGVGGVRALAALGLEPTVFHVNEGHSAFLTIERARGLVGSGLSSRDALEHIRRTTVFTTHTPVPAGNEVFDGELVLRYVGGLAADAGLSDEALLGLGRNGDADGFGLTPLALRLSAYANGVSELHGEVAREMWAGLWPGAEPPIGHVTNGVHLGTWLAPELARAPAVGRGTPGGTAGRRGLGGGPRARSRGAVARAQRAQRAARPSLRRIDENRLTIGFARRFATYKRAGLVFSDLERLLALPVQIVVAGKAHPQDAPGQGRDAAHRRARLATRPSPDRSCFSRTTTSHSHRRSFPAATSG